MPCASVLAFCELKLVCVAEDYGLKNVRQIWLPFSLDRGVFKCKGLFMCDTRYSPSHGFASGSYCAKFQK